MSSLEDLRMRRAAYDALADGRIALVGERDGEPLFALTEAGRESAESFVDAAVRGHGWDGAAAAIADALGISLELAESAVELRRESLGGSS